MRLPECLRGCGRIQWDKLRDDRCRYHRPYLSYQWFISDLLVSGTTLQNLEDVTASIATRSISGVGRKSLNRGLPPMALSKVYNIDLLGQT